MSPDSPIQTIPVALNFAPNPIGIVFLRVEPVVELAQPLRLLVNSKETQQVGAFDEVDLMLEVR